MTRRAKTAGARMHVARVLAMLALATSIVWTPSPSAGYSGSNWSFDIALTDTDGLAAVSAIYRGKWAFARVSIPQIRVDYAYHGTMNDQIGRAGIANVPYVSGSTRLTRTDTYTTVVATFKCCAWPSAGSYRYDVRYTFYEDGSFRPAVYIYGPGLEPSATYNVYFRMDFNVAGMAGDVVRHHTSGSTWVTRVLEGETADDGTHSNSEEWMIADLDTDIAHWVVPRAADGRPRLMTLRYHDGQGNEDLGRSVRLPSAWDNNESVYNHNIVEWYHSFTRFRRSSGCPRSCTKYVIAGPIIRRRLIPQPSPSPSPSPSPTESSKH